MLKNSFGLSFQGAEGGPEFACEESRSPFIFR
jgi:hypothetical protein